METPHDHFRRVVADTGDQIAAIRAIRERFGLDLRQAKEVMLQAQGVAGSLSEHEERIAASVFDHVDTGLIEHLRMRARQGASVAEMFEEAKQRLAGQGAQIVTILTYFRLAFCLSLAEAKPIVELSRLEGRNVSDAALLEALVKPEIEKHRGRWDAPL